MTVNYIVLIHDWAGRRVVECETVQETWDAIDSRTFGGLYEVSSPTGQDCWEFTPF